MSGTVFVDTSAWYALADVADRNHDLAARTLRYLVEHRRVMLTTNHIIAETYTLLRVRLGAKAALEYLQRSRRSTYVRRVHFPEDWEGAAESLLAKYDDQDLSYVDATSFVTMRHLRLREAFSFDNHFAILGFKSVEEKR